TIGNIPDGTSQTIAVVEAAKPAHWAAPGDLVLSPRESPMKQLGNHYGRGTLILLYDGSTAFLSRKPAETALRYAIDPDDGNASTDDLYATDAPSTGDLRKTIDRLLRLRNSRQPALPRKDR